jgi:hypothetical protein
MKKLFFLFGALTIVACEPTAAVAPVKPEMQLQVYDVPQGVARDLRGALNNALGNYKESGEAPLGRASLAPDGRLIVLAPERIQKGVAALVEQAGKRPSTLPVPVDLTYWFVVGRRGAAGQAPGLEEIKPALDEITRAQGPMQFRQLEQLKLSTITGEVGTVHGEQVNVKQEMTFTAGVVMARVSLSTRTKSVETTVQARPHQLIVLGQSGFKEGDKADEEAMLFYVIRADVRDVGAEGR